MLPSDLAKPDTEHAHQRAFFQWLNFASRYGFGVAKAICLGEPMPKPVDQHMWPELALMHAIPNGGFRNKSEAAKLRAEGVKAGVPDTFLPVTKLYDIPDDKNFYGIPDTGCYSGLYIEFKDPKRKNHKDGGMSEVQVDFGERVKEQGYCVRLAYTWAEAANLVMMYYGVDTRLPT